MAALDFPSSPTNGQTYAGYTYDGEKWISGTGGGAIYISDTPPTAPVGSLWWESDTGILYVRYNDGSSIQWVAIAGGLASTFGLTEPQKTQFRTNIYAAPFDALGWSGMQVNGSMEVSQERGAAISSTIGHVCDGWKVYFTGPPVLSYQQGNFGASNPFGFPNWANMAVSTAQPSLVPTSLAMLYQHVEGYRISRLAWGSSTAQPITIGFWTAHNRPGLYSVAIQNSPTNRSYVASYTHNVADTWEYKTVTIPGDAAGVWKFDNTTGMIISFMQACGSNYITASGNTWLTGDFRGVTGQVNGVAATSDVFRITGVVVLPGIEAPTAARSPLIMRPYDQELPTCQRYFQYYGSLGAYSYEVFAPCYAASPTLGYAILQLQQKMRAAPAVTFSAANTFLFSIPVAGGTPSSIGLAAGSISALQISCPLSGATAGAAGVLQANAASPARINVDARL